MDDGTCLGDATVPVIWPSSSARMRVGAAIWVLLLLNQWRSSPDGSVRAGESIRSEFIGRELGLKERQVRRALDRLRRAGYVELENTGRGFKIRIVDRDLAGLAAGAPR